MEPSAAEKKLIEASKELSHGLENKDLVTLESLFADDITVHADGLSLGADLHGKKDAADWFKAYFDRYEFGHECITGAVNDKVSGVPGGVTFSFWQDKNVEPKAGVFPYQLPEEAKVPTTTVGIWHLCFDASHKVKDLWFLRELSADEVHRKLKKRLPMKLEFDPLSFKGAKGVEHTESRRKQVEKAAQCYNKDELYGIDMLEVNSAGKIQRMVTFHELTSSEEQEYVKEAYQRPIMKAEE